MALSKLVQRTSLLLARRLWPGVAVSALVSTILLIIMGSVVRVAGYGLGRPDWPLCYGRVLPPVLTAAWFEFVHRLPQPVGVKDFTDDRLSGLPNSRRPTPCSPVLYNRRPLAPDRLWGYNWYQAVSAKSTASSRVSSLA